MPKFKNLPIPQDAFKNKIATISSEEGLRIHPTKNIPLTHYGIDIAVPTNTPVYSVADETVIKVGTAKGIGKMVAVQHSDGIISLYYHLNSFANNLKVGDPITAGQNLGASGNGFPEVFKKDKNGNLIPVYGYHLHLGFLDGNQKINGQTVSSLISATYKDSKDIGSLGYTESEATYINPRSYLAEYAIETTMAKLAARDAINHPNQSSVFLGTYENLSEDNKKVVDDLSSKIFSKDIDLTGKTTIDVEGDKRPNIITINKNGSDQLNKQVKHLSGLDNNDTYSFPTIKGRSIIEDDDGNIILGGTPLNNVKPSIVSNENNVTTPFRLMTIGGNKYYLTKCDDKGNGYPAVEYNPYTQTHLFIIPVNAKDIRDSIMIRDYFSNDNISIHYNKYQFRFNNLNFR